MPMKLNLGPVAAPGIGLLRGQASRTARQSRTLKAVIGGVATVEPSAAVKKQAEKRSDRMAAKINDNDLQKLIDALDAVVDDPASAPKVTARDRTAARALGTKPIYVAAVRTVAESDANALKAGLAWSGSLNAGLLAKVGDQAHTEIQLERIPKVEKKQDDLASQVAAIADQVGALAADVTSLKAEVTALKGGKSAGPKKAASASGSGGG